MALIEESARNLAIECAKAINEGRGTMELLQARFQEYSRTAIHSSVTYLKSHKFIKRVEVENIKYRALYQLTMPIEMVVEALEPKAHAPVSFSLLERCMGVPAAVMNTIRGRSVPKFVEKMGHWDAAKGRPKANVG